jgi:hypothetical protein
MWHILGRREVHIEFWWRNLKEGDHFKDLGIFDRITLKEISNK